MKHIPRFFIDHEIAAGFDLFLSPAQMFHATKVLRLKEGDNIKIFNAVAGEWKCSIKNIKKNTITPLELVRKPQDEPGPSIACALINPNRFSIMVEKIAELGVQNIYPIISDYTQYKSFNKQKVSQIIVQACEQSKRLTIPKIHEINKLKEFLDKFSNDQEIFVGLEIENTTRMIHCLNKKALFLVGPEGGFSSDEIKLFESRVAIKTFHFGHNILRSETAAIAFVSSWVALYG